MMEKIMFEVKKAIEYKGHVVIAIDGRAGAGKTTLANELADLLCGEVVPMDHFFLPPELRTDDRLAEAGGNVHYERFFEEVCHGLAFKVPFDYGVFDCSQMKIASRRHIENGRVVIVEGSYSQRPELRDFYDVRIFMDVEPEVQMDRIIRRNGAEMAERFKNLWIPLEEKYFEAFKIKENADIVLKR